MEEETGRANARKRCLDRPVRGLVTGNGRLVGKGVASSLIVDAAGNVLSGVTQGKLLAKLRGGEALREVVYPKNTTTSTMRHDWAAGGGGRLLYYELSEDIVTGLASRRFEKVNWRRGNDIKARIGRVVGGNGLGWWQLMSQLDGADGGTVRRVLGSKYDLNTILRSSETGHIWEALALSRAGADASLLSRLGSAGGGFWRAVGTDPVGVLRALELDPDMVAKLGSVMDPKERAIVMVGLAFENQPAGARDLARWASRFTGSSDEFRAWVSGGAQAVGGADVERLLDGLYVAFQGSVARDHLREILTRVSGAELLKMGRGSLVDSLSWTSGDLSISDGDVVPFALRAAGVFGKQTRSMAAKASKSGWRAHDLVAGLPEMDAVAAKGFTEWALRQDFGWADTSSARRAFTTVAGSWESMQDGVVGLDLREAWLFVAGATSLPGPLGRTPFARAAVEHGTGGRSSLTAGGYWLGSQATPMFGPAEKVTVSGSSLSGAFLQRSDPRGLFLGDITDCCQSIGSAGQECAAHGQISADGQFFVVTDKNGNIIAQSWAWLDRNGALCFDNIELLEGEVNGPRRAQVRAIYKEVAGRLVESGVPAVTVGEAYTDDGLLDDLMLVARQDMLFPATDFGNMYRDSSSSQLYLATGDDIGARVIPGVRAIPGGDGGLTWSDIDGSVVAVTGELFNGRRAVRLSRDASDTLLEAVKAANPGFMIIGRGGGVLYEGDARGDVDEATLEAVYATGVEGERIRAEELLKASILGKRDDSSYENMDDWLEDNQLEYYADVVERLDPQRVSTLFTYREHGPLSEHDIQLLERAGVGPRDYGKFVALGLADVEQAVSLAGRGITGQYVEECFSAGVSLEKAISLYESGMRPGDVAGFISSGVSTVEGWTEYLEDGVGGHALAGYRQGGLVEREDFVFFAENGVSGDDFLDYLESGIEAGNDMADFADAGISPEWVDEWLLFVGRMNKEQMIKAAKMGLTAQDIREFGYSDISDPNTMVRAKEAGLYPALIKSYAESNYTDISDIIVLAAARIAPRDAWGWGLAGVSAEDAVRFRSYQMESSDYRGLTRLGITDAVDLVRLANAGCTPEYVAACHGAGVYDLSDIIRLSEAGVFESSVKDFRKICSAAGIDDIIRAHELRLYTADATNFIALGMADLSAMCDYFEKGIRASDVAGYLSIGIIDSGEMLKFKKSGLLGSDASYFVKIGVTDVDRMVYLSQCGVRGGEAWSYDYAGEHDQDAWISLVQAGVAGGDLWICRQAGVTTDDILTARARGESIGDIVLRARRANTGVAESTRAEQF